MQIKNGKVENQTLSENCFLVCGLNGGDTEHISLGRSRKQKLIEIRQTSVWIDRVTGVLY